MIVAYRESNRAVFLYGFAKNDRGNISDDELRTLPGRELADRIAHGYRTGNERRGPAGD